MNQNYRNQLINALRSSIAIKDRRHRLKLHQKVFLGSDAVNFFMVHLRVNLSEAIKIGNQLIREKIFHHVYDDHLLENNAHLFYRLYEDETITKTQEKNDDTIQERDGETIDNFVTVLQNKTTQQQLIRFRLEVEGKLIEAETARLNIEKKMNIQKKDYEHSLRILLSIVLVLHVIIAMLLFHPTGRGTAGWVGYICILISTYFGLRNVHQNVQALTSKYQFSIFNDLRDGINTIEQENYDSDNTTVKHSTTIVTTEHPHNPPLLKPPPISEWPQNPVYLQILSPLSSQSYQPMLANDLTQMYTINNEYFHGQIVVLLKNINTNNSSSINQYFKGHKRITANYVQGKFKKNFLFHEILTGQNFSKPLSNLPMQFFIKTAVSFLKTIAPGLSANIFCNKPYLLTPLIAAAQTVHVAKSKDDAPSIHSIITRTIEDIDIEDTRLLGGNFFYEQKMNSSKRRKYFKNECAAAAAAAPGVTAATANGTARSNDNELTNCYNKNLIYTFGFWQDIFDPVDYNAHLPFGTYDISRYLNGQPMCVNGQIGINGPYLWDVKLWHTKLIPTTESHKDEIKKM